MGVNALKGSYIISTENIGPLMRPSRSVNALKGSYIISTVASLNPHRYRLSNMSFDNNSLKILKNRYLHILNGFS